MDFFLCISLSSRIQNAVRSPGFRKSTQRPSACGSPITCAFRFHSPDLCVAADGKASFPEHPPCWISHVIEILSTIAMLFCRSPLTGGMICRNNPSDSTDGWRDDPLLQMENAF